MITCYVDEKFVSKEEAKISAFDLGFQRGLAIFEVLRTYQKTPLFLNDHLARLKNSAKTLSIHLPEELEFPLQELIEHSPFKELLIQIIATRSGSFMILTEELEPYPQKFYEQGIHAITIKASRNFPQVKTPNYLAPMIALENARNEEEALYVKKNGQVLEGSKSNFFVVQKKKIITAPLGEILPGITRKTVLELGKEITLQYPNMNKISEWDEAFITSTLKEIVPVVSIDAHPIGLGIPGKETKKLMRLFQRRLEESLNEFTFSFDRV